MASGYRAGVRGLRTVCECSRAAGISVTTGRPAVSSFSSPLWRRGSQAARPSAEKRHLPGPIHREPTCLVATLQDRLYSQERLSHQGRLRLLGLCQPPQPHQRLCLEPTGCLANSHIHQGSQFGAQAGRHWAPGKASSHWDMASCSSCHYHPRGAHLVFFSLSLFLFCFV